MRSYEADFAARFDRVLLISKHDFDAIEQKVPLKNVFFNPHGVDWRYFTSDPSIPKVSNTLIFTGNMSYVPNVDAVTYFCLEILPLVRERIPGVKFIIVGADPAPDVTSLTRDPSVEVTGRVPDLRQFMNQAVVAVAPIRIGAGLQNKVLEGLSMGLPMVITSVANEGIQAVNGEHLLIAESAKASSDQIVRLLKDPKLRDRLGSAARRFIVENWSWEKHFGDLEAMFVNLVNQKSHRLSAVV
jgi:hypothetical protein